MATPKPHAGTFSTAVADLHRGDLLDTLDDELAGVLDAVRETGKAGKLVLTITVKTPGQGSDQVTVGATTKATVPKMPRADSLFYTDGKRLMREDPRQSKLDLRSVEERPEPEVRRPYKG